MNVSPLTVGPILGYVEQDRARLFGRGQLEWADRDGRLARRCFGVLRWKPAGERAYGPPAFSKMLPHFDVTGVGIATGLEPDTEYDYQMGWFFSDGELDDPVGANRLSWRGVPTHRFRTATADVEASRSFVFGSCRYLLRLFGGTIFEGRGDKTFRSILAQMENGMQTDALLMLGDQIYADDLNFLSPDKQVDEFLTRYREAFSQQHISRLMSSVPTYMTLDDHEIEDNWPNGANPKDHQVKYPAAIHSYSIYQMSHSPLGELDEAGTALDGMPNRFWYTFSDGCCDFFVLDARTERHEFEIIGPEQMNALKKWLDSGRDSVKIIVSSVPMFPDYVKPDSDKWSGFLSQRDELLNFIHDKKIRRVVTLSGDVHASMSVELVSDADPGFKMFSVVSSPFYWPYPPPSRKDFQLQGRLLSQSPYGFTLRYGSVPVTTENFTRLTVTKDQVAVAVFGRKGEELHNRVLVF